MDYEACIEIIWKKMTPKMYFENKITILQYIFWVITWRYMSLQNGLTTRQIVQNIPDYVSELWWSIASLRLGSRKRRWLGTSESLAELPSRQIYWPPHRALPFWEDSVVISHKLVLIPDQHTIMQHFLQMKLMFILHINPRRSPGWLV